MCTIALRNQVLLTGRKAKWLLLSIGYIVSAQNALNWKASHCDDCSSGVFLQRCVLPWEIVQLKSVLLLDDEMSQVVYLLLYCWCHLGWSGQGLISQNYSLLQLLLACVKNALHVMIPWAPEGSEAVLSTIPCSTVFKRPLFQVWWLIQIKYVSWCTILFFWFLFNHILRREAQM